MHILTEKLTWDQAKIVTEGGGTNENGKPRDLYMKGIFIQGSVRNHNQRMYPVSEIQRAVNSVKRIIDNGETVWGEADHPEGLNINLDRISHMVVDMWTEGQNGMGKLKIVNTPLGQLCRTLIESGGKLGVSSRGSGSVNESSGEVSDFEIITVDIVARPSAPNAYPDPLWESLLNYRRGPIIQDLAHGAVFDFKNKNVQKLLKEEVMDWMNKELKV